MDIAYCVKHNGITHDLPNYHFTHIFSWLKYRGIFSFLCMYCGRRLCMKWYITWHVQVIMYHALRTMCIVQLELQCVCIQCILSNNYYSICFSVDGHEETKPTGRSSTLGNCECMLTLNCWLCIVTRARPAVIVCLMCMWSPSCSQSSQLAWSTVVHRHRARFSVWSSRQGSIVPTPWTPQYCIRTVYT